LGNDSNGRQTKIIPRASTASSQVVSRHGSFESPIYNERVKFIRFELTIVGLLVVAAAGLPGVLNAQSAPGDAEKFEVASIRPSRPDVIPPAIRFMPDGGLEATSVTLKLLIQIAYDIRPEQLAGGSRWADSEQYDIYAKGPEGRFPAASDADRQRITRMCIRA
jgi:hypothetical protein